MKPRYYVHMYADNLQGVTNHYAAELIDRVSKSPRLGPLPRAVQVLNGQKSSSVRLGKALLGKLARLGIK